MFWRLLICTVVPMLCSTADANDLSRDEEVVFFPTYAAVDPQAAKTTFFIHGWIFEPEHDSVSRTAALAGLCAMLGLNEGECRAKLFTDRARRFLVDNERDQKLMVRLGARDAPLSASEENGHIRSLVTLPTVELRKMQTPHGKAAPTLEYRLTTPAGDARQFRGRVHLIAPEGWSVVSDIDDTIKETNVLDRGEMIRNTFLREFRAAGGMSEAYRRWETAGAAFHYVSGGPWQLAVDLEAFRTAERFPAGSMQLRYFRVSDRSIVDFLSSPVVYKRNAIETIFKDFPKRRFILVGDTGEQDPEVYGELARRFTEQVRLVALRNVTDAALDDARMQAALRGLPAERVLLFREASELPALDAIAP